MSNIIVPDASRTGAFTRFKVVISGWLWGVIPTLSLQKISQIDLSDVVETTAHTQSLELVRLADEAQNTIKDTVRRSAANRSGRVRKSLDTAIEQAILGTNDIPSTVMQSGRKAIQTVHQSLVIAAGETSTARFEKAVKKV